MRGRIVGTGAKQRYFVRRPEDADFVEVSRYEYNVLFPDRPLNGEGPGGHRPSCWPMISESAGVHPKQVEQERARCQRLGLGAEVLSDGTIKFADQGQMRDYLRRNKMYQRNGGYGDG